MSIFEFNDYRRFLAHHLAGLPKRGRGELGKIAHHLKVHPTLMSLIMSGQRELSVEQAYDLCTYLEFTELETDFFLLLLQRSRAGNTRLKSYTEKHLEKIRKEATKVEKRFEHDRKLTEEQRSVFYSSWAYSAIRLYCSTKENGRTLHEISERFQIPRTRALEILSFLIDADLAVEKDGKYHMGVSRTMLEHGSPHLPRHHMNWRAKSIQKCDRVDEKELMFTFPFSIAKKDFSKIRAEFLELLNKVSATVKETDPEDVACLNVDLFWIDR